MSSCSFGHSLEDSSEPDDSYPGRHTRDVADFAVVPVREPKDTLAVRICISGWLRDKDDVTAPWTVFDDSEDTLALQWVSTELQPRFFNT